MLPPEARLPAEEVRPTVKTPRKPQFKFEKEVFTESSTLTVIDQAAENVNITNTVTATVQSIKPGEKTPKKTPKNPRDGRRTADNERKLDGDANGDANKRDEVDKSIAKAEENVPVLGPLNSLKQEEEEQKSPKTPQPKKKRNRKSKKETPSKTQENTPSKTSDSPVETNKLTDSPAVETPTVR